MSKGVRIVIVLLVVLFWLTIGLPYTLTGVFNLPVFILAVVTTLVLLVTVARTSRSIENRSDA